MLGKRRKRNRSNLFGGGLLLLSSLSLVSIGFSTWTITDSASANLDITADDVVETSKYISILDSQVTCFKYNKFGVLDSSTDMYGTNGNIIIPARLSNLNLLFDKLESLKEKNELSLLISFRYYDAKDSGFDFATYISSLKVGIKRDQSQYSYSDSKFDSINGTANSTLLISNVNNTDKTYLFSFVYSFVFPASEYATIYSHLSKGDMHISLSISFGDQK